MGRKIECLRCGVQMNYIRSLNSFWQMPWRRDYRRSSARNAA